ncbi:MAG: hypothetical protein ABJA67_05545 [Chthonomonadales bacterium]
MSNNFIGPPKRDFDQLFKLAESELITLRTTAVEPAVLVAVCVNASQANGYFCCSPANYRAAMNYLLDKPKFNANEFLSKITVVTGVRKGQVPKFDFRIKNWATGELLAARCRGNQTDALIFACNWGIAQMPAWRIVENVEPQFKREYLHAFLGDERMQMRELIRLMATHERTFPNCTATMLEIFHADRRMARSLDDLVARDLDLANRLGHCADPISAGYKV